MVKPTKLYWKETNHVLRYLRGTTQLGIWYKKSKGVKMQIFIDAYWVGIPSDMKSTSGGFFSVRSIIVSWYRWKQIFVALNLVEVEHMATIQETCEAIWMRNIIVGLFG